jgi:hypothetical protein
MSSCSVIRGRHAKAPELAYESVDASVWRFADDDKLGCHIRPLASRHLGFMVRILAAVNTLIRSIAIHPLEACGANILHELLAFGQRVG